MMHIKVTIVGPPDRQGRPQSTTWTTITPGTPTFNPTKFTPAAEQSAWKPAFPAAPRTDNQETNVIVGSVKQDPSGGFVHTFGPTKPSTPQTASSNSTQNSPWQNFNSSSPSRQDSVNSTASPRYVQEIIVPSGQTNHQSRAPTRQTSFQSNASQFSPVQQSPQRSSPAAPVYFQPQNGYDNRSNGSSPSVYQTTRQTSSPYQSRQDSIPYQVVRQDSTPFQTARQESVPYQRQESSSYPNSWNGPSSGVSSPYQTARQDSWNQPVQQRQDSWSNQPSQQNTYQPIRQDSWSNQPNQQNMYQPTRQDSWSNNSVNQTSPPHPTNRQDSRSSQPTRPESAPYQPPSSNAAPGLFSKQNSASPSSPVRYDPISQNSTPGLHRQSSVQYQPSSRQFSPVGYSPGEQNNQPESYVPQGENSPYSYGVPGPFARQQSSSGITQPWSPGPVETFPTPPPFSPSSDASRAPWPAPSDLPSPPPPPPPPHASAPMSSAAPIVAPPPPPPPPPPPMPSSTGVSQDVPAWKKQIQATKDAKAAAGIVQTPGTPGSQELPAALASSMKRDKKPFTYLPGGLDLSEIRSPKMQRRLIANQQQAPPPPSVMSQQVLLQPQPRPDANGHQQVQNQMERLNLGEGGDRMAVDAQRRSSADGGPPGQSRSFRILQMMTGGDDETDSAPPTQHQQQQPSCRARDQPDEEMRFTGLRRPDNPIPSRAFQALQKMTQGVEQQNQQQQQSDPRFGNESGDDARQDEGPVDIRYKGGYIPGRSFKMLQEMTGMSQDGEPTGTVVPSVLQEKRQQQQQRKAPNLHLNIGQPQSPTPGKQFPQPQVPASQQTTEEAPKMYRGGRIPSQSFRMLQAMTGESGEGEDGTDM